MKFVAKLLFVALIGFASVGCGGSNSVETPANPAATPAAGPSQEVTPQSVELPNQGQ